jgi:DNA-binding transcriptional MerR regulator
VTRAPTDRSHLSIGEVLSLLQDEFPDVTISKIRFLESQGLLDPERTPSGYRKFYETDIERLRWILRQQKDHYLPLKVIKDRLDDITPPDDEPEPLGGRGALGDRNLRTAGPSPGPRPDDSGGAGGGPRGERDRGRWAAPAGTEARSPAAMAPPTLPIDDLVAPPDPRAGARTGRAGPAREGVADDWEWTTGDDRPRTGTTDDRAWAGDEVRRSGTTDDPGWSDDERRRAESDDRHWAGVDDRRGTASRAPRPRPRHRPPRSGRRRRRPRHQPRPRRPSCRYRRARWLPSVRWAPRRVSSRPPRR